jgi:hypothetical protein
VVVIVGYFHAGSPAGLKKELTESSRNHLFLPTPMGVGSGSAKNGKCTLFLSFHAL